MDARELRIGNYIAGGKVIHLHQNNFIEYEVEEGHSWGSAGKMPGLEPIPLTEEWLLKFGFKVRSGSLRTLNTEHEIFTVTSDLKNGNQCIYNRTSIKHVHQLQNLYFALTGTELEMK